MLWKFNCVTKHVFDLRQFRSQTIQFPPSYFRFLCYRNNYLHWLEDITCVWFFFSSIRGSVLNHFNFNCVLEGSVLTKTLLPFCVFSSTVDTTTRVKRGDLFSYSLKTSSKGGATSSKPWELYGDLIELYGAEGGWVLDFCSGSGELFGIFFPVNIFFAKFTFQHPRPISFYYKSFVTIAAKKPNNLVTRFYCQ